jgi:hypothetical protein
MFTVAGSDDVEKILNRTVSLANASIKDGILIYLDGARNENNLFAIMQQAVVEEGFSRDAAQLISGHKFPDVIFAEARIGIEIKGHKQGDRILGNSIMGSTLSLVDPVAIYLLAWNDSSKEVVWRNYFDCVIGAEVTHSPRFVLKPDCSPEESLFGYGENQIGDAEEICLSEGGFKSDVILARMRAKALAEGNIPWWISSATDDEIFAAEEAQQQMSIVKYSTLSVNGSRSAFLKTVLIGFPELFGKSASKYDSAAVWSLLRKNVLINRDAFTAGGKVQFEIPTICVVSQLTLPQVFKRAKELFDSSSPVKLSEVEDIWQTKLGSPLGMLKQLRTRILDSGIDGHKHSVLHTNCSCSEMTDIDFANRMIDWLLVGFQESSIV